MIIRYNNVEDYKFATMTPERTERLLQVLNKRQDDITVVLENVSDPHNISAVMRTCDAVGIQEIYVLNTKIAVHKKWGTKSSSSAYKWLTIHQFTDATECFAALRNKYDLILTTHLSSDAISLHEIEFTKHIALVFGNEHDGVSQEIREMADGNFIIPQVGIIKSLNISVACAVSLYEAFRQKKMLVIMISVNYLHLNTTHCLRSGAFMKEMVIKFYFMRKIILIFAIGFSVISLSAQSIKKIKITALQDYIASSDHPLVVNFWATFCDPCVKEIPYFQTKVKEYSKYNVELLLVNMDLPAYYPARISDFAAKRKFSAPIVWLNETNADEFCPKIDKNWTGGIPSTLFINNKTNYRKFFERQLTEPQVEEGLRALVKN